MTFPIQSIEFFDINNFPDASVSPSDLSTVASLFQDYKNLGVNTVTIGWGVPVDENTGNLASSFANPSVYHAASLAEIQSIADVARQLGLSVILKPQADTVDPVASEGNIDNINSYSITEPSFNANTFLTQWASYMKSVGALALQVQASMVVVGTENSGFDTATYLPQWTNVINSTRASYSGDLTYASFNQPSEVSFWSQLDEIGIDAYYGLTSVTSPTYQQVLSGWTSNSVSSTAATLGVAQTPFNIVSTLQALSALYTKPLYFSEFGGQSFQGVVNDASGAGPPEKVADWQQQEWLFQSAFQTLGTENTGNWFQGVNMWAIYPSSLPENSASFATNLVNDPTDFDVRAKPAALVAASWFGAKDYLGITDNSFIGSIANDQICLYGSAAQVTANVHLTQAGTFNTVVSVTMGGTIMNGQAPTVHFYVNGVDEGVRILSTTPGGYIDANGVSWSGNQSFTFTLPGLVNVDEFKVAIDSSVATGGVENAQTYISAASVDGVALANETYTPLVGSSRTAELTQSGQYDGGYALVDTSPWNTGLADRSIGTAINPIQVNGGGGIDTVYVLGSQSEYALSEDGSGAWHLSESSGLHQNSVLTNISFVDFQDGSQIELGKTDFIGSGAAEVLLENSGTVVDWIIQNGLYSSGNVLTTGATGYTVVGTGDFIGNGVADVLLQNGGTVVDWIMKNGQYQSGNVLTTGATGYTVVGTGDFNADGTSDVLLQNGGTVVDWIMQSGLYQSGNVVTTGATGYTVVGTGDFNGDGTSDVLLQNGGTVVDWIMQNGTYQSGNVITTGATGFKVVGTGDFDGDGTTDVLLQNGGTVVDWIMKNGQYQSGNVLTTAATGFTVVGTGDYNGDGTSDVLLQNGGTVVDWIMKNGAYQSGNVITTAATGFTVSPS